MSYRTNPEHWSVVQNWASQKYFVYDGDDEIAKEIAGPFTLDGAYAFIEREKGA